MNIPEPEQTFNLPHAAVFNLQQIALTDDDMVKEPGAAEKYRFIARHILELFKAASPEQNSENKACGHSCGCTSIEFCQFPINSAHSYTEGSEQSFGPIDDSLNDTIGKNEVEPSSVGEKPDWYTKEEIFHWLKRENYCEEIALELSGKVSNWLQGAFDKGVEKTERAARKRIEELEADRDKFTMGFAKFLLDSLDSSKSTGTLFEEYKRTLK